MPKMTHTLTGPASKAMRGLTGRETDTIAIYGDDDLNRRLAAAKAAGVTVTVRKAGK